MRTRILSPALIVTVSILAWASLYVRQYLPPGPFERLSPLVPAALALLALAGLVRAGISSRLKTPLFLSAVLTIGAGVILVGVGDDNPRVKKEWREREGREIAAVLDAVGDRVDKLLGLSTSIGDTAGVFLREHTEALKTGSVGAQLDAFTLLGSLSTEIAKSGIAPSGTDIGMQLFDSEGRRWAWAGWPQLLEARDRSFVSSGKELVYSRQVSLYRMLTHVVPVYGEVDRQDPAAARATPVWLGSVVIDIPLEVNYRVNNKFLKSAGLADDIARESAANIRFDYLPVDPRLPDLVTEERGRVLMERVGEITGNETLGLSGRGIVRISPGNELFNVSVDSRPFAHFIQSRADRVSGAANLAILLALVIYLGLLLRYFPAKWKGPGDSVKALYLLAAFALFRFSLVWFQPDLLTTRLKVFEPAVFATPILGGLMRSAGDLLITSLLFVVALYGVIKIGRGVGRSPGRSPRSSGLLVVLKGLFAAAVSIGAFVLARSFIGTTAMNANPRLVGETVKILEPEVVVLHLSAFLMVAGIFLAGMICIWGANRLGRVADAPKAALVGAAIVLLVSLALLRIDMAVIPLCALLFAFLAPRLVRREDLVSIVIGAFCFVIVVSAAAYVFFNQEYQDLRRTFIREKAAEVTHPADNWKVFILEDILENFSEDASVRQSLADPVSSNVQRLAFDLWAASPLSLLGYSCAIHVFDTSDSMVSRFAVEMPYRLRPDEPGERLETPSSQQWAVLDLTTETPQGAVRFYRGIVNLENYVMTDVGAVALVSVGKIVVDVPFFFESLAWAARTGPQTPEVLRNVQVGGIAPRLEETEPIVLARVRGTRVLDTSSELLPVGYTFDPHILQKAADLGWPLLRTGSATYRFFTQPAEAAGTMLIAGFAVPTPVQHVLRWSMILSLYFFFTVGLIASIIVLKNLPVVRFVLPSLTPGRQLGFQQKLLGSFLLVALLPAVILGVFSVGMIKNRFVQESRNEALYRAFGASKSLNNLLVEGLHALVPRGDVDALLRRERPAGWRSDSKRRASVWVIPSPNDRTGGEGRRENAFDDLSEIIDRVRPEQAFLHYVDGKPCLGMISEPISFVSRGERQTLVVYHGRVVDAELLGEISDQAGADVNVFDGGQLVATSREGLLSGGFISSTMNADAFVKVSMMGVDHALSTEKAGRYSYQVAYVPVPGVDPSGNAAIGVPLLFRPESYSVEVDKARSVVLSIFALLSAATIGLGLFLARGIFRPLRGLLEGTQRIARGDFSFELPGKRRDEIGTVVEAFNEMTRQVSRSQTALEERRKYLEVILANIGTGVVSTDAAHRISAVNSAAERILGMRRADLVGKTAGELADAGDLRDFFSRLASEARDAEGGAPGSAVSSGAPGAVSRAPGAAKGSPESRESFGPDAVSSEVDIVKDGQKRTIKYVRTELATEGRYLGAVFVFEDLTELINSKKLSAWVEMARQIAHEIKNPLTPIKLSTQFMVRAHQERSTNFDKIFRESSETIMQQVDVLRNIASEFSSFGRLQQLYLAPHDVVRLIGEIVSPYRRNATGVTVILDTPGKELRALIDPEAVRKICTNLVENAMEAMAGGGELQVSCAEATLDGRRTVAITFRDTGPGLSKEARARLFEPYFSTKTTGTGLGLAICRSLSREMGGDVTVENIPGGPGVEAVLYVKAV